MKYSDVAAKPTVVKPPAPVATEEKAEPKMVKKYTNWADDSSDDEEDDLDNFVPDAWDA